MREHERANGDPDRPVSILGRNPDHGTSFRPVAVAGSGFDAGAIPYFGAMPSIDLFEFRPHDTPLMGSVSVGFTTVPLLAPLATSDVTFEHLGQRSNPFPFTKN